MINSTLLGLIGPLLIKLTIDFAFLRKDLLFFNVLALIGISKYVFSGLLKAIQGYLKTYLHHKLDFKIRSDIYKHLHKLSIDFFQKRTSGEQMFRLGTDIDKLVGFLENTLFNIVNSVIRLVFLLMISFWIDPLLSSLAIVITPVFYYISHHFGKKKQQVSEELLKKGQDIFSNLQESFSHIKLIKAFGREKYETRRYLRDFSEKIRLNFKSYKINYFNGLVAGSLNTAISMMFGYYVGYKVITGQLSLGSMAALTGYLGQLFGQLSSFGGIYQGLLVTFVSFDRILETLDAPIDIPDGKARLKAKEFKGEICFDNVSFSYLEEKPVIKNISFVAKPGSVIGLVGHSGIGKSTILNLILRFYDPQEGTIFFDGKDIREYRTQSLRDQIGIVLQEPFLLNDTVFNNIKFGMEKSDENQVHQAARSADIHDFIMSLPEKYDTRIGESSCFLSEGQKQRISIARALIRKPKILVLDEATSSISADSENQILQTIYKTRGERTTFIVSHRLSAVAQADRIIVLDKGFISESGSHKELIDLDGIYNRLFQHNLDLIPQPVPVCG